MATDIAFVGELGGKRLGSAGRTIRLIRLFEVSTRLVFVRRLIFPCVLIRADALLATFDYEVRGWASGLCATLLFF